MVRNASRTFLFAAVSVALTLSACSRPVAMPHFGSPGGASGGKTNGNANDGDQGADTAYGSARLWRLTVPQLGNTLSASLGKSIDITDKFDPGARPEEGFGIDALSMGIDSIYASNLETVLNPILSQNISSLTASDACLTKTDISADCLNGFLQKFAATTFRRPMTNEEIARYTTLFNAVKADSKAQDALAAVAEAMLRSPYTQFRFELGAADSTDGVVALSPYEIATELSFAITAGPPDKELLASAASGNLMKKEELEAQIRRLMASDAFIDGFSDFAFRLSGIQWIGNAVKDGGTYPEYTKEAMTAMQQEAREYIKDLFKNKKGSFKSFMTSVDTTITPPLAPIYKVDAFQGSQKHSSAATERAGFFTLPAVLAANSPSIQTGPVQRGVFLLKKLMCTTPPPPPANIKTDLADIDPTKTLRERFASHSTNPQCSSCHLMIDPFGFSLENYDAIGRYRDTDAGKPVDASGKTTLTKNSNTTFKNGVELLNFLSESKDVHDCFVRQAFRYTFGRGETTEEEPLIQQAYQKFVASDYDINEAFLSLYTSDAFRFRKAK